MESRSEARTAFHWRELALVAPLVALTAAVVQYAFWDFPPILDDLVHLSGVAEVERGDRTLADFLMAPHNEHLLPLWKLWFYGTWKVAGLEPAAWHVGITAAQAVSGVLLYILLRYYFATRWASLFAALLWSSSACGCWDNPHNWIGASHLSMAMAALLAAMIATRRLPEGGWRRPALLALSLAVALATMGTILVAAAILPLQYWLLDDPRSRLPKYRATFLFAWLVPLAAIGWWQVSLYHAMATRGISIERANHAAIAVYWTVAEFAVSLDVFWVIPPVGRAAEQNSAGQWVALVLLTGGLAALRGSRARISWVFLALTLAHTFVACRARGIYSLEKILSWGRYHYMPELFWCVLLGAFADWALVWLPRRGGALLGAIGLYFVLYFGRQLAIAQVRQPERRKAAKVIDARLDVLVGISQRAREDKVILRIPDSKLMKDLPITWSQYALVAYPRGLANLVFVPPDQVTPDDARRLNDYLARPGAAAPPPPAP